MTDRQKIYAAYIMFCLAVITSITPHMIVQNISMILSVAVIISLYILRSATALNTAVYANYSDLIRTFWIWSMLYAVGVMGAGILIFLYGDMSALNNWAQSIAEGAIPTENDVRQLTVSYIDNNYPLIVKSMTVCLCPATGFAAYKLYRLLTKIYAR